jgi:proteasome assembly chaperone (PAC2) family protein
VQPTNEFFLAQAGSDEFLVFLGSEPHRDEDRYATAFLDAVEALGVRMVASVAGVHGPVPYRRRRNVSSVYSIPRLKERLSPLDVRFSNYEGGATIGMFLASKAEDRGVEFARLCAYVPSYELTAGSTVVHRLAMDEDYKAWHDVTHRLNQLLGIDIDLTDLASRAEGLLSAWDDQIEELSAKLPRLRVKEYLEQIDDEFEPTGSAGEDDLWESALRDIGGVGE